MEVPGHDGAGQRGGVPAPANTPRCSNDDLRPSTRHNKRGARHDYNRETGVPRGRRGRRRRCHCAVGRGTRAAQLNRQSPGITLRTQATNGLLPMDCPQPPLGTRTLRHGDGGGHGIPLSLSHRRWSATRFLGGCKRRERGGALAPIVVAALPASSVGVRDEAMEFCCQPREDFGWGNDRSGGVRWIRRFCCGR